MIAKLTHIRFNLGKDQRLKSRKHISTLFSQGKQVTSHPIRAIYQLTENKTPLQAGFAVSSKNFRKAVDRNRIKRLMRESYRLQKNELENLLKNNSLQLIVFFVFTGKDLESYDTIFAKMKIVVDLLTKKAGNPASSSTNG